jgi:hypothetical protein
MPVSERSNFEKVGYPAGASGSLNKMMIGTGGGYSSVRERFDNSSNGGSITPLYENGSTP